MSNDFLKSESMWDGHLNRQNTGRIQDKLRDPERMKTWRDQYGIEAAEYIDRLEKERDTYKHRMIHLDAMQSQMLRTLANICKAVRPEGIQAPDGRVFEYDPTDPEIARLHWKVMSDALRDGAAFYRTQGTDGLPPLTDAMYHAVRGLELEFSNGGPDSVKGSIDDDVLDEIWEAINTAMRVQR